MATVEKRLGDIIDGLSPEDKGRLVAEDSLRPQPVLSPSDGRKMLRAMGQDEASRFHAFLDRTEALRQNLLLLMDLVHGLRSKLLDRDRILWYYRALVDLEQAISWDFLDTGAARSLLVDNPNLKPGKPVVIKVPLATIRLGVWGKKRATVSDKGGVELSPRVVQILDLYAELIRAKAAELKAVFQYAVEEARAMGLDFLAGLAISTVQDYIAGHDISMKQLARESEARHARWDEEGLNHEERLGRIIEEPLPHSRNIFPVDDRWALDWDEIEEDPVAASRIRQDPNSWKPVSHEHVPDEGLLDHYRQLGRMAESS